jgi:hypothetical protein
VAGRDPSLALRMTKKGAQDDKRLESAVVVERTGKERSFLALISLIYKMECLINMPLLLLHSRKYGHTVPLDISLFKKNRIHY